MREVPIDEVFGWKEEFFTKGMEAFGRDCCDVSSKTFSEVKDRCYRIERENDPFFEQTGIPIPRLGTIHIHVNDLVPDGVLVPCQCRRSHE